jgi:hypothetical protein
MSPKRHTNGHPADAPAEERRPTRRPQRAGRDRQSPDEAATVPYRVPRCYWPAVWTRLVDRSANFSTTRCDPWPGGHVDVLVAHRDASILGGLATRLPAARDPWPAERLAPNGRDWRALDDTPGDDALDRAFRAAEKAARDQRRDGVLDPVEGAA